MKATLKLSRSVRLVGYAVCLAALVNFLAVAEIAAADSLFDQLTQTGVKPDQGPTLVLSAPTIADGMSAAQQHAAIEEIAKPNHTAEALLRKSVVAPFILKIADDEASKAAGGTGRRVDLWFVVYGDLQKVRDTSFWANQANGAKAAIEPNQDYQGSELSAAELAERNIKSIDRGDFRERFFAGSFVLFDRVRIRGTVFTNESINDESALFCAMLDPRFVDDEKYPNTWQPIRREESGKLTVGQLQPYRGAGSYMKATQLSEPANAILVEYHLAFDEPQGWFNGANLLRSKLPILVQDSVRKFRRKLADDTP